MFKKSVLLLIIFQISFILTAASNPKDPDNPSLKSGNSKDGIKIELQKQNGYFVKGTVSTLKGIALKGLSIDSSDKAMQSIPIDTVKTIRVKGYTMDKKTKDNLSMVFYYPYVFDIELNDGTKIKGAKGRIKEIESFELTNDKGSQKCYTYFIRYWLEDKKMFSDNKSKNYNETPKVNKDVVIYIEFNKG
jgi:hypothetical protein